MIPVGGLSACLTTRQKDYTALFLKVILRSTAIKADRWESKGAKLRHMPRGVALPNIYGQAFPFGALNFATAMSFNDPKCPENCLFRTNPCPGR
jgi:hypothetical protein